VLAGGRRVGQATVSVNRRGKLTASVRVGLSASIRRSIATSLGGVPISVQLAGRKFDSTERFSASAQTTVVAPRVVGSLGFASFARGSSTPNARTQRFLKKLASTVRRAKRVVCTGHPDPGSGGAALARARANAACSILRGAGLRAKYETKGALGPRNGRIELTILR
jgi:hypothetical protein